MPGKGSSFSEKYASKQIWSRNNAFSIADALGDCTLADFKQTANRMHELRARMARLSNVVDMVFQIKMMKGGKNPKTKQDIYKRYL